MFILPQFSAATRQSVKNFKFQRINYQVHYEKKYKEIMKVDMKNRLK